MKKYVLIKDLLENGAEDCKVFYDRPNARNVGRYITINEDEYAECGRGDVTCSFKGETICSHYIYPASGMDGFERRLTIGDLEDCAKWLLARGITS